MNNKYYLEKKKQYDATKKAFLAEYKQELGCAICGYNSHPAALTFDHIDPNGKVNNIANYGTLSWEKLLTEITKCRVLCANCHFIHTSTQQENGVKPIPLTQRTLNLINRILGYKPKENHA